MRMSFGLGGLLGVLLLRASLGERGEITERESECRAKRMNPLVDSHQKFHLFITTRDGEATFEKELIFTITVTFM